MARIAYINGKFVPLSLAQVSIEDRGYQFADGIYEVIALIQGDLIDLTEHLLRLEKSLSSLHIEMPVKRKTLVFLINQTVQRNKLSNGTVYIQITRGVAPRAHIFPDNIKSSLIICAKPYTFDESINNLHGVSAITLSEQRWARPDIKSIALLPNVLSKQQAFNHKAFEAIFVQHNGYVSEGSHTNVFIVAKGGIVKTHPATQAILNGITRQTIIKLCNQNHIPLKEEEFSKEELLSADEVFLTGTTSLVKPVLKINDEIINKGEVGYFTRQIAQLYFDYCHNKSLNTVPTNDQRQAFAA